MILSFNLLLYAMLFGGLYIFIIDLIWSKLEKIVPLFEHFPKELIETKGIGLFIYCFAIEFIFFVFLPAIVYYWFYSILPVSGIRGGIGVGLFLFTMGIIPFAILILFRIKIPVVYLLYQSLGLLIKVVGSMAIIGYLYSL